jgi:TonB-linked SusC/RagA family outer membrane protein
MKKTHLFLMLFVLLGINLVQAQTVEITGTVTGAEDGMPLPGVTVVVQGTTIGTVTDTDGNYTLSAPQNVSTIVFSFVGMVTQEVDVAGRSVINVVLESDAQLLEQVLVVAYGTTTREAFTGSAEVISSRDLESRALTSAIGAIEGTTAGVQVLSASGQPGSAPGIVIRGVGTLNGTTAPLYIVDGIQYEGSIANINTEDIESMTILKDAASTALYGSRAANGVVLITTKSGQRAAGLRVNASASAGAVSIGVPFYDNVNPGQYYELMTEAYKNALITGGSTPEEARTQASATIFNRLGYNPFNVANDQIVGTDGTLNPNAEVIFKGLNWYDALTQPGLRENYSLNVSGGGELYDVFFSTAYLNEKGYVITSAFDRLNTRLNGNFRPKEWLALGGNLSIATTNTEGPFSRGASIANPFSFAKNMGSIYPVYIVDPATGDYILDAAGEKQYDLGGGYSEFGISPRPTNPLRHAIAETMFNSDVRMTNNISSRYYAEFKILPELKFTLNYGVDVNDYINKAYENETVGDGAPFGRYSEERFRRTVTNFNQILNYNKGFGDGHTVDVTLGHESFDRHYSEMYGMKNTQTVLGIREFANFSTTTTLDGYSSDKRTEGYFARLNYDFLDKYYFSTSFRRDGSSVFSDEVRWGNFYSVGGSWRLDREAFIQDIDFISSLRLRASYGEVGQDNLNDFYISQPRYSLFPNAGDPGIFWSDLGNTALTWETSSSWDLALEYGLFNSFLTGSVEYWERNSTDLLYNVPLPLSVGLSEGPANIASVVNRGFEIGLTANLVRTNDFNWSLSVNASTVQNEITEIPEPFIDGSKRWEEGRSRYDFFIYDYAGVDPDNGDALYYMYEEIVNEDTGLSTFEPILDDDGTHMTTTEYQDAGKTYANKSSIPDLFGGVRNDFSYKGFGLSFLFSYGIGGTVLDYGYADMMHPGSYGNSMHPDLLDGWRNPGDDTDIPRMENGNPNLAPGMTTRFLTDASYLALRNVNLSYTFQPNILQAMGVDDLRVFVTGENLFILTARKGLNPQYNLSGTPDGADYNPSRVISAGLNISF